MGSLTFTYHLQNLVFPFASVACRQDCGASTELCAHLGSVLIFQGCLALLSKPLPLLVCSPAMFALLPTPTLQAQLGESRFYIRTTAAH